MASFYLGAVSNANVEYYNVFAEYPRQFAYAAHLGDSWRISPKLTLNYSLRWDYIAPFKEKFNNLSFFDPVGVNPTAINPLTGAQQAGRLAFAGTKWGSASYGADFPERPFKNALAPRVGFAYSVNDKTVVRAGYGIYYGQAFYPGWNGGMSQDGFNKNLNLNESSSGNFFAAVSYVGTKGTHLPSALSPVNVLNPFNPAISGIGADLAVSYTDANGPATFATYGFGTTDTASSHIQNWASTMTGCKPTIAQALLPYPQYCGVLQGENEQHATSIYHSFQAHVERHLAGGLYVLGSLTVAKLYTDASDTTQAGNTYYAGNQGNNGQFSPYNLFP